MLLIPANAVILVSGTAENLDDLASARQLSRKTPGRAPVSGPGVLGRGRVCVDISCSLNVLVARDKRASPRPTSPAATF
jgi:hypothetical protein